MGHRAGPRFSETVALPGEATPEEDLSQYPKHETEALGQLKLHTHGITSLDFSPDGKLLCSIGQDPYHLVGICTPHEQVAEYRWMSSARLVYVIPRDVMETLI